MKKKLTAKQKRFCQEYVVDYNGKQAAIRAGYSKHTAAVIAKENLQKPLIQEKVEQLKKKFAELAQISSLRNLKELAKLSFSNINDFYSDWGELRDWGELTPSQKAAIRKINHHETITTKPNGETVTTRKIQLEMYDKRGAIESINKMMGYNAPDKLVAAVHTGEDKSLPELYDELKDIRSKLEDLG